VSSLIEIDGSYGEGGGQILRTALALSVLTGKPARIANIRARRKNPGLAPQHLTGVLAAAAVGGAEVRGAQIGSTEITFTPRPGAVERGSYEFDVAEAARGGSAGSVTLILQTILLPLAFSGRHIEIKVKGGTHVAWSPPFDYFSDVFLAVLSRMGLDAGCSLDAWGFYPVGGGEATVRIGAVRGSGGPSAARTFEALRLTERGTLIEVSGRAVVSNLPKEIADRMARRAADVLGEKNFDADIRPLRVGGRSTGAGLFFTARYEHALAGFSALGKKGLPAERVALEACRELFAFNKTGAAVDRRLADQLVLPMALARGRSEMTVESVTPHLLTNVHVIRRFVEAAIEVEGAEGEPGRVVVEGIGWKGGKEAGL
jgi:RNA 3'-terminal phosphate cyclase (ATP)